MQEKMSDLGNISTADYRKHETFSLFFRNIFICSEICHNVNIMEIAAEEYNIDKMLDINFDWRPIYQKYSLNDILEGFPVATYSVDTVVMPNVIESIHPELINSVFTEAHRVLMPGGLLVVTTPTPRKHEGMDLVCPTLNTYEYSLPELILITQEAGFFVSNVMPWHVSGFKCVSQNMPYPLQRAIGSLCSPLHRATQIAITLTK